jgi:hypothetical protein
MNPINRLNPLTKKYFVISLLFPVYLCAVEGKDPIPEIKLLRPELKEEEVEIAAVQKFPRYCIEAEFGEDELGEGYKIQLRGEPGINDALHGRFLKLDDKLSLGGGMEKRVISSWSLAEVDVRAGAYKIEDDWAERGMVHGAASLYWGENVVKMLASGSHESEFVWDAGILWGRSLWESVFVGLGISGPRYITPLVQINWPVNQSLLVTVSHRSKEVTGTLDSVYMNQPHVVQNPHLEHEQWNALSTVEFTFLDLLTVGITYKEIENAICWHPIGPGESTGFVEPVNGGKLADLSGYIDIEWKGIENHVSYDHRPFCNNMFRCQNSCYCSSPKLFTQTQISFSHDIRIGIGGNYVGERTIFHWSRCPPRVMQDYWLLSISFSKKLSNMDFWVGANNVINTDYEIVPGVWEQGCHLQAGINITLI